MRAGKLSETALKRSVLQQMKTKRGEVTQGAAIGEDCAVLALAPGECFVISSDPVTVTTKEMGRFAACTAVNDLAAAGAEPIGLMVTALLPLKYQESRLKELMCQIEEVCAAMNLQVMGGHTEVTEAVNQPILSITAVGKAPEGNTFSARGAKPGQDIVLSKWIGLEGTAIISREMETQLKTRFPRMMLEEAKNLAKGLSVLPEAALAGKSGVSAMHDLSEGGIYSALYELSEAAGVGLEIDLRAIPIRQETVELCEYFGLNPYYLISGGSLLMVCDNGQELVRTLEEAEIPAAVIGRTTSEHAKAVRNNGEVSYLERPKTDEIYKMGKGE